MRILIVDDGATNRLVLNAMLEGMGEVVMAENGVQAVWAFEESLTSDDPFDLVCLDIIMPEMDGLEALHTMRAAERRHEAKRSLIVMVTASRNPDHMLAALKREGCDGFVVKPVLWQTLRRVIARHGLIGEGVV
ncbi:response regulator [Geomonas sp.]|uniref:response regulator n=1 Tax=Geomonas sp. TaxID=2651584 RepID=UPI002B45B105|nr:response regulator [Geomonas sp.]HJV34197.1 response regulator [Geomonas sp.]